ncbi:Rrf2 family transcriptional regulator [Ruminococcaceae bacterium OttesenSCG-928-A11]|nr:Rrf2 family transcriptional regulator [Ruminococcaceae bacterium OttesenSCG-928-A11]
MYITQEADYAIRIVRCLAKCGRRRDARSISEEVNVTLRFSLKILGKLSGAGIVNSFKGNRGGYELARPAAEITLKDVLGAVEGPYAMSRCVGNGEGACTCGVTSNCAVQNTFKRISDSINTQLAAVNFATILEEEGCGCGC